MGFSKFKIIILLLVVASIGLLLGGMCTRWYYISYSSSITNTEYEISFYSPKIKFGDDSDRGWGSFHLPKTHSIFNTCLAFSAFAFMIGIFMLGITLLNHMRMLLSDKIYTISRCMVFGMLVCTFIAVAVLGGSKNAFKNDFENTPMDETPFPFCFGACDSTWRGEYSSITTGLVKFGPSTGWILTIIALFTLIAGSIVSILSFIFERSE